MLSAWTSSSHGRIASRTCSKPSVPASRGARSAALADERRTVPVIDMNDLICTSADCPPDAGNVLIYFDGHHFTQAYSQTLAPFLKRRLLATGAVPDR